MVHQVVQIPGIRTMMSYLREPCGMITTRRHGLECGPSSLRPGTGERNRPDKMTDTAFSESRDDLRSGRNGQKLQLDRAAKHAALLDEAARTLNRRGVTHTSLAKVAADVGMTRAGLYHYVSNQEDLVYQCYVRTCEQLSELLRTASSRTDNAIEALEDFIAAVLDSGRPELAALADVAVLEGERRNVVVGLYCGLRSLLADMLADGIARGQVRPCDTRLIAAAIIGVICWVPLALAWLPAIRPSRDALLGALQSLVRRGLAADRAALPMNAKVDLSAFILPPGNPFDALYQTAARREQLLVTASWLFSRKGFDATTLEEVGQQLGVTKKAVYHHMGSKEALAAECYRRGFQIFQYIAEETSASPGERIDSLCGSLATLAEASVSRDLAPFVPITGLDSWSEPVRAELLAHAGALAERYGDMIGNGIREGSIRTVDAAAVITIFPGYYEWFPRWTEAFDEAEIASAPDEIASFLRLGLEPIA